MDENLRSLELSRADLEDIRRSLRERILEGFTRDGREVRALPAFLSPLDRWPTGKALAIDVGGTHIRAAIVELTFRGARVERGPVWQRLDLRGDGKITGEAFFAMQARLATSLEPPPEIPVGYCFSYPSLARPDGDATLLHWTKDIDIPGIVGTEVGSRLRGALARAGLRIGPVRVLNDTVASLLAGVAVRPSLEPSSFIGLVVGTGTNMAGFFPTAKIEKLATPWPAPKIAINLESGNFYPPHLTPWDDALDAESQSAGRQRFEKAIAGHYLPHLFDRILPGHPGFDPRGGAKALVEFRDRGLETRPLRVAAAILSRSADLVAAGLAGVIDLYEADEIGVLCEGSLFWNDPKYAPRVNATLSALLGPNRRALILRSEAANLIGAALASAPSDREAEPSGS